MTEFGSTAYNRNSSRTSERSVPRPLSFTLALTTRDLLRRSDLFTFGYPIVAFSPRQSEKSRAPSLLLLFDYEMSEFAEREIESTSRLQLDVTLANTFICSRHESTAHSRG
jgi:hypothetical protein